jgi:dUTPase
VTGEAIAVDFMGGPPVGHRHGRHTEPRPSADTDLCAGVDLRACRAATGGRLIPQHRVFSDTRCGSASQAAQLRVLRDRSGLGGFGWLFTDRSSVGSPA